jgi:hypothetical protein
VAQAFQPVLAIFFVAAGFSLRKIPLSATLETQAKACGYILIIVRAVPALHLLLPAESYFGSNS